jgi:hypothetical protein
MALPIFYPFKTKYYSTATTSSSGAPVSSVVVAARCKYVGGYFLPNNAGTSTNVTGFDVIAFLNGSTSGTVISSGTSVTTTTGTLASAINVTGAATYLNAGDVITTVGSTSQAGFVTHVVREF